MIVSIQMYKKILIKSYLNMMKGRLKGENMGLNIIGLLSNH